MLKINILQKIVVEKLGTNDTEYTLTLNRKESGQLISRNELIAHIESSKTSVEILCPVDGYLYLNPLTNNHRTKICPGFVLAIIVEQKVSDVEQLDGNFGNEPDIGEENDYEDLRAPFFTAKAIALMKEIGITREKFLGYEVVTERDVARHIDSRSRQDTLQLELQDRSENFITLIGGRGTAKMCIDLLRAAGNYQIYGLIDPDLPPGDSICGVKVLGGYEILEDKTKIPSKNLVLAFTSLASLSDRLNRYEDLKRQGYVFPVLIHPKAMVEPSAKLSEGTIVLAGAIIGSDVRLGPINFVNTGAIISHDVTADFNNHFAPGATLAGRVNVGSNNLFGMNCNIYMDLKIGNFRVIKNGESIFSDSVVS
jgi:sugar O-acyltransferase (sialic acid O-acetyltransferase NeuD family)